MLYKMFTTHFWRRVLTRGAPLERKIGVFASLLEVGVLGDMEGWFRVREVTALYYPVPNAVLSHTNDHK